MPRAVAPEKREQALADVRAGMSLRAAARKAGVSQSTMSGWCAKAGVSTDRSATKKAVEAAQVDHAALLVKLAGRSAGVAANILTSFESMTQADWQKVSPHTRAIALGICADKARELAPATEDAQVDAARSLLVAVMDGMVARHGDS